MRTIVPVLVAPLVLLLLAACGADGPRAGGASTAAGEPAPTVSEPDPNQLYEINAMVLEDRTHGPMLCLGGVLASLPPQCGDVPIASWSWRVVEGEEVAGGTTWGMYHVVGRYDGETFAVTRVRPYEESGSAFGAEANFTSPCRGPAAGWTGLDRATQEEARAAHAYARSQPEYVASWVTHLDPPALEFGPVIVNVVFTGESERHRAEIKKVWPGPLCVIEREVPSARELGRIRKEAEAGLSDLGLQMLWSQGPDVEPVIEIGVVVDVGGNGQAAFDARYGPGVIRLIPALEPLS